MRPLFSDVAGAALPVAIVLIFLAAGARAALALDDERARRIAREYLEPLCTWSLIAALAYAVGIGAGAKASVGTLAVLLVLAAAAILLRPGDETAAEPEPPAPAPAPAQPEPAPVAPPRQSVWTR
jgi:peptidoglycan/LPS O-acetylase OafA/YrhL